MERIYDFLKKAKTYYLATTDGEQPRVRPFGTIDLFEGKLYIQTGNTKDVSKQIMANPKIEICTMLEGRWIRVEALAIEDDRYEAKAHMLDAHPSLKGRYSADDGITQVFYLKDVTATISSFTEDPIVIKC